MKKVFAIILLSLSIPAMSNSLQQADSLFAQNKFTESFEIYKQLLEEQQLSSPAMLLKMAYIKEGLKSFEESLYYLNLYYLQTADKKVLFKMEELAEAIGVSGYEYNDLEFIQMMMLKYANTILLFLLSLAFLLLTAAYYIKFKKKESPTPAMIAMVFVLAITFAVINVGLDYNRAIVKNKNTFFMSAPSAAGEPITIIKPGHRVKLLGHEDVWTKIEYDNRVGFVKTNKLLSIQQ